jgi:ketosteroid isomerase-like protein
MERAMTLNSSFLKCVIVTALLFVVGTPRSQAEQQSDTEAVTAANVAFEKALSARDINAMEKVWARKANVIAIHPSSKAVVVGWEAVRKSWEGAFDRFAEITVSMKEPQIRVSKNVAWIVGVEAAEGKLKSGDPVSFAAFTTNMYEKRDGHWLMVLHASSRVPQ